MSLMPVNLNLTSYVLSAAVRDKLIISLIILIIMGINLAIFMGSAAITEQDQYVMVFAAGGLRMVGALGLILFVVFYMRRAFETKDVEFLLTKPITRTQFLLSHALAFSIIALFMGLATGASIFFLAGQNFAQGHALWIISLICEFIIMANSALFFSMVITSATGGALATLGLYVLSRMMGQILGIIDAKVSAPLFESMESLMQIISALLPRLDLMGQTSWLIYGMEGRVDFAYVLIHGGVFCFLILSAALMDLMHKQF